MVWFFERGIEMAVLEVRRRDSQFEVSARHADGSEQVDLVPTPHALFAKLESVPRRLFTEGWRPVSNRSMLAVEGGMIEDITFEGADIKYLSAP